MVSYIKKTKDLYLDIEEWEKDYIPFLKHAFLETDTNWCADPYNDPDSKTTKSEEFYRTMTIFLNEQEKSFQKFLNGHFIYTFDILSHPYIKVEEVYKEEKHHLFYIKSDQFGFSAPSKRKNHPYDSYIIFSDDKDQAITNVAKWIYESRTIGGAFWWPLEVDDQGNICETNHYNIKRGGSLSRGSYIQDRVDLTLLEIMMVLEKRKNDKVILNTCYNEQKNMKKWLDHFNSFDVYKAFFCFDSFVNEKGIINIIESNVQKPNYIGLTESDIGEKQIYKGGQILPNHKNKMEIMFTNVNSLINKRTKKMLELLDQYQLVDVLLSKCVEKYEEAVSGIPNNEFYGAVPKLLVVEYMDAVRKTEHFYSKTYIKSWDYRFGGEIEERYNRDEDDNFTSGMYFSRAKASFYYDQERRKAFVGLYMGPTYGSGFEYDIESKGEKIELANEKLAWMS